MVYTRNITAAPLQREALCNGRGFCYFGSRSEALLHGHATSLIKIGAFVGQVWSCKSDASTKGFVAQVYTN